MKFFVKYDKELLSEITIQHAFKWLSPSMRMAKKAFLVGISDYATIGPDLRGCINDVKDMANTLVICGFLPKDIGICTDQRATKQNIVKGIASLVGNSKNGDSIVFYYAGHGSQTVSRPGDRDEPDGQDEGYCVLTIWTSVVIQLLTTSSPA